MFFCSILQKHIWPLPISAAKKSAIWYKISCPPLKLSLWRLTCQRFSQGDKQSFNSRISFRIQHLDSQCNKHRTLFFCCVVIFHVAVFLQQCGHPWLEEIMCIVYMKLICVCVLWKPLIYTDNWTYEGCCLNVWIFVKGVWKTKIKYLAYNHHLKKMLP